MRELKDLKWNNYLNALENAKREFETDADVSRIKRWLEIARISLHEASLIKIKTKKGK